MIYVYDDILTPEETNIIEDYFTSRKIPWYYQISTLHPSDVSNNSDKNTYETPLFTHVFLEHSTELDDNTLVRTMFLKFISTIKADCSEMLTVRANISLKHSIPDGFHTTPHCDIADHTKYKNPRVVIYYVNDSDGDTIFFTRKYGDEKQDEYEVESKVSPKKGRFVLFSNEHFHAQTHPQIEEKRIVLVYNFY